MGMDYRPESEEVVFRHDLGLSRGAGGGLDEEGEGSGGSEEEPSSSIPRGRRAPRSHNGGGGSGGGVESDKIPCRICGDSAVRHIHYGGHCCFSCKAFFRRAVHHQTKTGRSFKCKFDGTCEINMKNRKTCQSCRFQKCVDTGMNPSWVLSDDQRKKRFKKYREQKGLNTDGTNGTDSLSSPDSITGDMEDPLASLVTVERHAAASNGGVGRRRVKSAPDRAPTSSLEQGAGNRGRGRKYGGTKQGSGCGSMAAKNNGRLGLHCGGPSPKQLVTASQPVSPVDSICSIDFSQTWAFPDVIKTEPVEDPGCRGYGSVNRDSLTGYSSGYNPGSCPVTSPVKLEADSRYGMEGMYDERNSMNVDTPANSAPIKEEVENMPGELDLDQLDRLQALIASVDFTNMVDMDANAQARKQINSGEGMYDQQATPIYSQQVSSDPLSPDSDSRLAPGFPLSAGGSNASDSEGPTMHYFDSDSGPPLGGYSGGGGDPTAGRSRLPANIAATLQTNNCCELSPDERMSIMKLEMSFENSNSSFPLMSEETSSIWEKVISSCNFIMLNTRSTATSILNEAVELCLRRNLIFLQENSDFTSLTLETRTQLYINNMGSMCHVRGLLHQNGSGASTPGGTIAVSSSGRFQSSLMNGGHCGSGSNFTWTTHGHNGFHISYKDQRTGKVRVWKTENGIGGGAPNINTDHQMISGGVGDGIEGGSPDLLMLIEEISALELDMVPFLMMLLLVLFSSGGCNSLYSGIVDSLQNKYLSLLYRYLQSRYDQPTAKKYMSVLMKFVISLLDNTY